jgi:TRAP-type mannitol/chloroaromatic compound transport system substrate-binding protein
MAHTAPYYFFGKDDTFAFGTAIPFGLNARQMNAWMIEGNGLKLMREFYAGYNIINFPGGNTGAQMGGWFRKPVTSLADLKGLQVPHRRLRRQGARAAGRRAAEHPRRRYLPALEKGTIDAAEWVGPYDDMKLGFNKVAPHYAYPAGGKAARSSTCSSIRRPTTRCRPSTRPSSRWPRSPRTPTCWPSTTSRTRPRCASWSPAAPSCSASPRTLMEAGFKEATALYSEIAAKNANFKKMLR